MKTYFIFHKNGFYNGHTNKWVWVPLRVQKRMWYWYAIKTKYTTSTEEYGNINKELTVVMFCPKSDKRKDINKEFGLTVR